MGARATNETGLVGQITKAIKREYPDSWVFKVHGGQYQMAGVPDLLVCVSGLLIGMEVKFQRPAESREHALGRVTPGQRLQIKKIAAAGGMAGAVLSVDEALDLIRRAFLNDERRRTTDG